MESKYETKIDEQALSTEFQYKTAEFFDEIREKIISVIHQIDMYGGKQYYNFFQDIFDMNPNPNYSREDLKDPQFCRRNKNKFVMKTVDNLLGIPDLTNIMGEYFVGTKIVRETDRKIVRECDYFDDFKVKWTKTKRNLTMKNNYIIIQWSRDGRTAIDFEFDGSLVLYTNPDQYNITINYSQNIGNKTLSKEFTINIDGYLSYLDWQKDNRYYRIYYHFLKPGKIIKIVDASGTKNKVLYDIARDRGKTKPDFIAEVNLNNEHFT